MTIVGGAVGVIATAVCAVVAPVWTYAVSLALFGLPHVLVELRYVDERFGARIGARTVAMLVAGLAGVVLARLAGIGGLGTYDLRASVELLLGVGLMAAVVPVLARRSTAAAALGLACCTAVAVFAVRAPVVMLVALALLHNLTPVGFLSERLRGGARRRAMLACALVFVAVPALILTGTVEELGAVLGLVATDAGPPGVGMIELHIGAFVPPPLIDERLADDLFRAAAFLQCMHYAVVLHVLPRLGGGSEADGSILRWPRPSLFTLGVAAVGVLMLVGFARSFGGTRAVYGVFAAVHAWVEIPILLLALAVAPVRAGRVRAA